MQLPEGGKKVGLAAKVYHTLTKNKSRLGTGL
ncbi:hypothetical protein MTY_2265 [Moorella thermoacetica Y72]|uniref:Uncharacterized protein n=1 Tax=Moorella thermoacetica Y72 TaxID=1325331 RepID=A0A0S6UFD4_NEOTH|nr:hypothetical protein MTY_2265 [Moorella thermoacetica Y72]